MELHVDAQHTEVDPTLRDWIRTRCEAWNTPYEDIVHARVTLGKHPRHLRGSDEARVVLTLSGKTLSVTRAGDTLEDALYEACDVMERERLYRGQFTYRGQRYSANSSVERR
jgi:ribosome-associated translation inhibitor RaiA